MNQIQHTPPAAWMQYHFNQTMDTTPHRRAIAQSLLIPSVGVLENTPLPLKMSITEAPDLPAETNTVTRRFWLLAISQIAANFEPITNTIRELISSVREWYL